MSSIKCFLRPEEISTIPSHPISECTSYFIDNSASVMMIGDSHLDTIESFCRKNYIKWELVLTQFLIQVPPPFTGLYTPLK